MFTSVQKSREINVYGVGLGLFITKQIVEQFNGQIAVKSKVGKGTRVTFSFELEQQEDTSEFGELQ